jgi:ribosomal protein S18 acetylase RimI-like enzyme
MALSIIPYLPQYRIAIRPILEQIGWPEQYITASEQNADTFSQHPDTLGSYVALFDKQPVGFMFVQHYAWNQLAQIQGLFVDPSYHRQRIATALVNRAETFARERGARGIYVDTPVPNERGRKFYEAIGYTLGYIMPRYYEDNLDGVTYQKFFDEVDLP